MKIEHIRVDGFGRLTSFDTGPESLGRLVVVLGPNEAGKSTLFSFLTTALYGFSPASRELSPYVPWGADEAGGEVRLKLRDGSRPVVARRLRSTPSGTLVVGDTTQELRNRPVRWVEHVPRTVFRQVFAITLAELAGLDEDTWGSIQDRVLGSMGASDLRSARQVADELEKEAGEIWRPNRRGNQRLRDLQAEIRALRSRRHEAVERDRQIRALVEERENVHLRLQDARDDRLQDKVAVERMQELIPLKRQLDRIDELRQGGGSRDELRDLPADLVAHREERVARHDRLSRSLDDLDADLVEPESAVEALDEPTRRLLAHHGAISAFLARAETAAIDRERASALATELAEVDAQMSSALRHLVGEAAADPRTELLEAIDEISLDLLSDRIERLQAARGSAAFRRAPEGASADPDASALPSSSGVPFAAILSSIGLGAALLAWGLVDGPTLALAMGAALLAVGLTLTLIRRSDRTGDAKGDAPVQGVEIEAEIQEMLAGVPVQSEFHSPPGPALTSQLRRIQELIRARGVTERRRAGHVDRVDRLPAEAAALATELGDALDIARTDGADDPTRDPIRLAADLRRAVADAEAVRDEARGAEKELARLRRSRLATASELADAVQQLAALDARILALAPGAPPHEHDEGEVARNVERAVRTIQSRLEAHARADRLEEELERTHTDLAHRRSQIRQAEEDGVQWTVDGEELARRKRRIEDLDEVIEELAARAEALERDALHLREQETVDAVDSEVESLREEESTLRRERDRKWLLARLIREADRRFREDHQPDLLRRASEYIEHLTGGRYDKLVVDEEGGGDLFHLMGPQLPAPVPLSRPISTGTLEQAYLALRLAIVDHLDQSEERLPLFMDEAFVNWDDERRQRGLAVLTEVSRSRQVFAFTCHPTMADELARRGACVLRLER